MNQCNYLIQPAGFRMKRSTLPANDETAFSLPYALVTMTLASGLSVLASS